MNIKIIPRDKWEIDPAKTALIVVDMQRAYLDKEATRVIAAGREFVPKINELADMCRKLRIPVIYLRNVNRPDLSDVGLKREIRPKQLDDELDVIEGRKGADFYPEINIAPEDYIVSKIRYSAFIAGSSHLEPLLRGLGSDRFIICGVATDVCVGTTTMDAMMLGFRVFIVGDLTATFTEERQRVTLQLLNTNFAKVTTFEEVSKELTRLLAKQ